MQFEGENRYFKVAAESSNYQNTLKTIASAKALRTARDLKERRHRFFLRPRMDVLYIENVQYGTSNVIDMLWKTGTLDKNIGDVDIIWGKELHISGHTYRTYSWVYLRQGISKEFRLARIACMFSIEAVIFVSYITVSNLHVSVIGSGWNVPAADLHSALMSNADQISTIDQLELVLLHKHASSNGDTFRFIKK